MWTKESVITTDRILAAFPMNYHKVDVFYYFPVFWRGGLHLPPPSTQTLVVTGHSDLPVLDSLLEDYPVAVWWGTNVQTPRAHGIPLGITNCTDESPVHSVFGDIDMMLEVREQPRSIENLVYMNFSIDTYPQERQPVWDLFVDKPWVTHKDPNPTRGGRKAFLSDLRNHTFVVCPRGFGVDTCRLWETLYMGSIPIVRRDIAHEGWTDLPILFVDSWEEVTEERLRQEEQRFQTSTWAWEKLDVRYWIKRIRDSVRTPRTCPCCGSSLRGETT